MSDEPKQAAIERVIVPLDAASENRTAIDTAAHLAARVRARLLGIFVEDEDLLNLASLPFSRQITLGAAAEPLTPDHVALHLRLAADRAHQQLLEAAQHYRVAAGFEIVRGAAATALSGLSEADLVVAGGLTRPIGAHFRLTCRWWSSIEAARGPFLLARHHWRASGSIVAMLRDRGAASGRLLRAAAQIAEAADRVLTVIAATPGTDQWIAERLAGHPVRPQVETGPVEPAALHRRLAELDCRLLAVEAGLAEERGERLREFVERFAFDILIVR